MEKFFAALYARVINERAQLSIDSESILQQAEGNYYIIEAALQDLKEFIIAYTFRDEVEEIRFFKEIKPSLLSELIYYIELYHFELNRPVGDMETVKNYCKQEAEHIRLFFERNHFLYTYYRTGKTIYDRLFFLRPGDNFLLVPEYSLDMNPKFSTVHSFNLSKLQAYEQFNNYLQETVFALEHPEIRSSENGTKSFRNLWTESKAALIELAYALHARGAVNNGRVDVKQIIISLEQLFNVKLGNFYRTYQGMRIRKKNRTAFLDNLKESLEKKMDQADLNF